MRNVLRPGPRLRAFLFALSVLTIVSGVFLHGKLVWQAPDHKLKGMDGMGMSTQMAVDMHQMRVGMILLLVGTLLAVWSIIVPYFSRPLPYTDEVVIAPTVVGRRHRRLLAVLLAAVALDTMKPFTLAFVLPGMRDEYGISQGHVAEFPLIALIGTVVGSLIWGRLGDRVGRRPLIVFSSLLFAATSACGGMPTFNWNLLMCFFMGAAAGGLLPVALTLSSELMPTARRSQISLFVGAGGALLGYLAASSASALILPHLGWRFLWLIGLPSGLALLCLVPLLPESPRYLLAHGQATRAHQIIEGFGGRVSAEGTRQRHSRSLKALWRPRYRLRSALLAGTALAWGTANFGFLIWLPTELKKMDLSTSPNKLLAISSLLALPGIVLLVQMHPRWGNKKMLSLSAAAACGGGLALIAWSLLYRSDLYLLVGAMSVLVLSLNAVSGVLLPYTAESFPTALRSSATGIVAAGTKIGGIWGPPLVVLLISLSSGIWLPSLLVVALLASISLSVHLLGQVTLGKELEEERDLPLPQFESI